jgi:hypothetical protein
MSETRETYTADLTMERLEQAPVAEPGEQPRIDRDEWRRYIDELLTAHITQTTPPRCPYCHREECSH